MASADNALIKLADLRKAIVGPREEDVEDLRTWERGIKKMRMAKEWLDHPVTKEVYAQLTRQLVEISTRLSTEGDMPEEERRRIFEVKKAYLWLLSIHHSGADDALLEQIEADIEKATVEWGEFSKTGFH